MSRKPESVLIDAVENAQSYGEELQRRREKRLWKPVPLPCSLHEALSELTKDDLTSIRVNYHFQGMSTLKKADLITALTQGIPMHFKPVVELLDQGRYDLIRMIVQHKGVIPAHGMSASDIEVLRDYSLLFPGIYEGQQVLFLPVELTELFQQIDTAELRQNVHRNTEWIQLAHGMLHYYGVMDLPLMIGKINALTGQDVKPFKFIDVMSFASEFYGQADPVGYGYKNARVLDAEKIREEQQTRPDIDYYPFTKKQLFKASHWHYVDRTPELIRLIRFLRSNFEISDRQATDLTLEICQLIQMEANPSELIHFLQQRMEFPSFDFVQQLLMKLTDASNSMHQWVLKGHTPKELFEEEKKHLKPLPDHPLKAGQKSEAAQTKVGRNDPCPCGSGKKYKKCCGR